MAAIAEESRRAGWGGTSTRHERASDRTGCSSMIYRVGVGLGLWIGADGGGVLSTLG